MKRFLLFYALLLLTYTSNAQTTRLLEKTTTLLMPGRAGENGGTVAMHGQKRYYYATLIGNKTFPIAFFDGDGERMSPPDLALLADIRGLWYNKNERTFFGNGFGKNGWYKYIMDEEGLPYDIVPLFEGQQQPAIQSVAAYHAQEDVVYFLTGAAAVAYQGTSGKVLPEKMKIIKTGYTVKQPPPANLSLDTFQRMPQYNTTLVYTGVRNGEFGLLNIQSRTIELYSAGNGLLTQRLQLPPDAVVKEQFNFAFCNNTYWLYDASSRSWIGYQ
jgi:hypothetical protein